MEVLMAKVGRFTKHNATPNRDVIHHNWPSECGTPNTPKEPFSKKENTFVDDYQNHQQVHTPNEDNVDADDDADDGDDDDDNDDDDDDDDDDGTWWWWWW